MVITDFNGFDQTRRCQQALRASHCQQFTTLVIDHGSDGATRDGLASEFPQVIRIEGLPDLWWTGATNLGIQTALELGATMVMLLNNECYVTPETMGTLLRLSKEHPSAIIAPIQRDWRTGKISCFGLRSRFLLGFTTINSHRSLASAIPAIALR